MIEEKDFKIIAENLMTEKAPINFEENLMLKIEALNAKPVEVFKPIISNNFWVIFASIIFAFMMLAKFSNIQIENNFTWLKEGLGFIQSIPLELTFIVTIPIFLYFVDAIRLFLFKKRLQSVRI